MNKIKNVAKRLLGKESPKPYVIDSVARTSSGYCIVGWYATNSVKRVGIIEQAGSPIASDVTNIERPDVVAATGKAAKGFQLVCNTSLDISEIQFVASCTDGNDIKVALTLRGEIQPVKGIDSTTIDFDKVASSDTKGSFEYALFIDNYLYVAGWLLDGGKAQRLEANVKKAKLIDTTIIRYTRQDVVNAFASEKTNTINSGLLLVAKYDSTLLLNSAKELTLTFELEGENKEISTHQVFNAKKEPMINAQRLLNAWQAHSPSQLAKADMFIPILDKMYSANIKPSVRRLDFGTAPSTPKVSMVIPLYGRIDFMRYQLSNFERFLDKTLVEVIYVLDDPKLVNETTKLAREMSQIVTMPFSVLMLGKNVGFGRANNIGVEHAKGDTLLLLNSDILPKTHQWLEKLLESAEKDDVGIVGSRLLFEDETLQHDGMAPMTVSEYPGLLFNDHPRKGWPLQLAPFTENESPCTLLTAACWMIKKSDFEAVGGFDPMYILGDFEDSDLCLKIEEIGKTNVIRRDVELYHLERQSQNLVEPGRWKHNITVINAIKYNKKWKSKLSAMEEKL
ncbi:glycosyltransferase family 2 protein [Alteromonas sp. IB21]|uniref:glycosyltransferase family 2 protein n=1 Tax=Alteromonas sp. IB21 TaxID=2779369 RepID=UPI0018E6EAD0|nr:glycosyltransferase family 2 protein [Alteromonas sp. IB21]